MANDDGKIVKMEVDYTSTVDEALPKCQEQAKEGKLKEALDTLLALEKQTRSAADMHSTSRILVAVVQMCYEAKDYTLLNEHIVLLSKRRSQLKQAVTNMVQECCKYVEEIAEKETKLKLIETLRSVTAGKIYVEIERARLTLTLAKIREADGDITSAATVLQELQVETYGSMERKEKVEFILEQMRLCIAKDDYIRTQIISKKINVKFFEDTTEEVEHLKLKYYKLMIQLDQHEGSYLSVCKHYRAIYQTQVIKADQGQWEEILRYVVFYIILAPYNNEQSDLIHRIKEDANLENLPKYRELLDKFTTMELVQWKLFKEEYEPELSKNSGEKSGIIDSVFNASTEHGEKCWQDLKKRIVEHNIMVLAKYYTRITQSRMSELLELSVMESEEFLCQMVVSKTVDAKIDRLAKVVCFERNKEASNILNDWSHNINSLMSLLTKSVHLINKEEMIHQFN